MPDRYTTARPQVYVSTEPGNYYGTMEVRNSLAGGTACAGCFNGEVGGVDSGLRRQRQRATLWPDPRLISRASNAAIHAKDPNLTRADSHRSIKRVSSPAAPFPTRCQSSLRTILNRHTFARRQGSVKGATPKREAGAIYEPPRYSYSCGASCPLSG